MGTPPFQKIQLEHFYIFLPSLEKSIRRKLHEFLGQDQELYLISDSLILVYELDLVLFLFLLVLN